jgi:hypothetical protein
MRDKTPRQRLRVHHTLIYGGTLKYLVDAFCFDRTSCARYCATFSFSALAWPPRPLLELDRLLREERKALDARPYGFGHGWNVWALTVEIESIRRSKGTKRCADMTDR